MTVHGRGGGVGVEEHRLLRVGVGVPLVQRREVGRRQLPLPHRVDLADDEPGVLLALRHREPQLHQVDAGADPHLLEPRRLAEELVVVVLGAVVHDVLDAGPVVPGAVEQHDLAGRGEVLDVPLEVPLATLSLGGLGQGHDSRPTRVEVLHEPLDGAALAGRVAPLEQDDQALVGVLDPLLELQQLDLQQPLHSLVVLAGHPLPVGVALPPGVDGCAVDPEQHRVVVRVVEHLELGQVEGSAGLGHGTSSPGAAVMPVDPHGVAS